MIHLLICINLLLVKSILSTPTLLQYQTFPLYCPTTHCMPTDPNGHHSALQALTVSNIEKTWPHLHISFTIILQPFFKLRLGASGGYPCPLPSGVCFKK